MPEDTNTDAAPSPDDLESLLLRCVEEAGPKRDALVADLCARFPDRADEIHERMGMIEGMESNNPDGSHERFGPYTLLHELGRGGQGTVWLAEDSKLGRKVALKVLNTGPASGSITDREIARFRREAEAASKLDHPNICTLLDAGNVDGVPFLAFRHVEGETLVARIEKSVNVRRGKLNNTTSSSDTTTPDSKEGIHRIVAVFEKIARALHKAHEKGLIHRDIKPGNIMLTADEGEPVILDFGLARDEFGGDQMSLTHSGDLLGTPAYMSPEQLMAHRVPLDRRTDIYSLGATLYEVLTLEQPFNALTRAELYQQILHEDPKAATGVNRHIPRDLQVVLETAMEKDRNRRYQSALDFAEDLRRFREFEPIRAKPIGRLLRTKRWAQRHPGLAVASVALFALLGISLGFLLEIRRELAISRALSASAEAASSNPRLSLARARDAVDLEPRTDTLSRMQAAMASQFEIASFRAHGAQPNSLDYSEKHGLVLTASSDKTALLSDLSGPRHRMEHPSWVGNARFAPDQSRILTWCSSKAGLWDLTGALLRWFHPQPQDPAIWTTDAAWHPGSSKVLTTHSDGSVRIWDTGTDTPRVLPKHHDARVVGGFFLTESEIVTWDHAGTCRVWNWIEGVEIGRFRLGRKPGRLTWLAPVPGQRKVVAFDEWGQGKIWHPSGEIALEGHSEFVVPAHFSRSGDRFLTFGSDATVRLWSSSGQPLGLVAHQSGDVNAAVFLGRENPWLCSGSGDTTMVISSFAGKRLLTLRGHGASLARMASIGGDRLISADLEGWIKVWNLRGWRNTYLLGHEMLVTDVAFDGSGRIATSSKDGRVRVWDATRSRSRQRRFPHPVMSVCFAGDGETVLVGTMDGSLHAWSLDGRQSAAPIRAHRDEIWQIQCAGDGRVLTCSFDGTARLWSADRQTSEELCRGKGGLKFGSWSPDNNWIALPSNLGVRLCDGSGKKVWDRELHGSSRVRSAAFDSDGKRLLTASEDSTARLWDLDGKELHSYVHPSVVTSAVFSSDDRHVLTASRDGKARLWTIGGNEPEFVMTEPRGAIIQAVFDPTGEWVVTCSSEGHIRFWPVQVATLIEMADEVLGRSP